MNYLQVYLQVFLNFGEQLLLFIINITMAIIK